MDIFDLAAAHIADLVGHDISQPRISHTAAKGLCTRMAQALGFEPRDIARAIAGPHPDPRDLSRTTILEYRDSFRVYWSVPGPACDPDGQELLACLDHSATVRDCVNMQRYTMRQLRPELALSDEQLLNDVVVVNWAFIGV